MNKLQSRVWDAYVACDDLCGHDRSASEWLERAFDAACAGEKRHRAAWGGGIRYTWPIAAAARYFAVKWFLDLGKPPESYADACQLREDCLYAYGARDRLSGEDLRKWAGLRVEFADVLAIDYTKDIGAS